jgi:ATP-dependent DNA helicase RecG
MVIENAERFGLSQLHQLRGRVGRGADQSFCILMTGNKMSKEARERVKTMVETNDGFKIAETDLKIRGPGDLMGTQQSGVLDLHIADLSRDGKILQEARSCAEQILDDDSYLESSDNQILKYELEQISRKKTDWSIIS